MQQAELYYNRKVIKFRRHSVDVIKENIKEHDYQSKLQFLDTQIEKDILYYQAGSVRLRKLRAGYMLNVTL